MPEIKEKDEKKFLTALAVSLMIRTGERVGNSESCANGHLGVSGFQKRNIKINSDNKIFLKYVGKSGVKHEKEFTDETLAKYLKQAIKNSPNKYVFCTSDGFKIKNDGINRYLKSYSISAKAIRGFCANDWTVKKLNELEVIPDTEAARTKELNIILKKVAAQIGHGAATLKKHYLIPELSEQFIMEGKVIELKTFMEEGGEIDKSKQQSNSADVTSSTKIMQNFDNSEKKSNFVSKITKDEIEHIISGTRQVSNGANIQSVASYLKGSEGASSLAKDTKLYKKQEADKLKTYITKNDLWVSDIDSKSYVSEGAEQKVYLIDEKTVIKTNDSIFYNSWEDYFHNLLLHNYFFPANAYELIGFTENDNVLCAVVKQPFIKATEITDLEFVKKFLAEKGFVNTKNNDYKNSELGIILEDLHEGNVLTENGILQFIDTVFYISPEVKFATGGDVKTKMKTLLNLLQENPDTLTSQEKQFLHELSETFGSKIALNNPKANKLANSFGIFDKKVIKELLELSVVIEARKIANS